MSMSEKKIFDEISKVSRKVFLLSEEEVYYLDQVQGKIRIEKLIGNSYQYTDKN